MEEEGCRIDREDQPRSFRFRERLPSFGRGRQQAQGFAPCSPRSLRTRASRPWWTRSVPVFGRRVSRTTHTRKPHAKAGVVRSCKLQRVSGIGNAYSDEILHGAQISPFKLTQSLKSDEIHRLYTATRKTLEQWIERLREQTGSGFPDKVTAFRPEMAVHGKYRQPCRACGSSVQRIVYKSNETNYCPTCQTEGKVLRDRALSRLLKSDWPSSIEELEAMRTRR